MSIIKFRDGNELIRIHLNKEYQHGCCDTCDFGSKYINELSFYTTHFQLYIKTSREFEYALTEDMCMKICLCVTDTSSERAWIKEVENKFKEALEEKYGENYIKKSRKAGRVIIRRTRNR